MFYSWLRLQNSTPTGSLGQLLDSLHVACLGLPRGLEAAGCSETTLTLCQLTSVMSLLLIQRLSGGTKECPGLSSNRALRNTGQKRDDDLSQLALSVFTTRWHWPPPRASWIQSKFSNPIPLRSIIVLFYHLRLGLPSGVYPVVNKVSPYNMIWRHRGGVWTWVLDGGGRWTPRPCLLTSREEPRYPLCRRLDGPHGRSGGMWRRENVLTPQGFEPLTVQPVARRYTVYAIPAPTLSLAFIVWWFKHYYSFFVRGMVASLVSQYI